MRLFKNGDDVCSFSTQAGIFDFRHVRAKYIGFLAITWLCFECYASRNFETSISAGVLIYRRHPLVLKPQSPSIWHRATRTNWILINRKIRKTHYRYMAKNLKRQGLSAVRNGWHHYCIAHADKGIFFSYLKKYVNQLRHAKAKGGAENENEKMLKIEHWEFCHKIAHTEINTRFLLSDCVE